MFLSMPVVAVGEEIVFRGVIHRRLRKFLGKNAAMLLSSAVFTVAHFDFSRFLPTFVIGLFTAYSMERTGSIAPPLIIHGINNSMYFVWLFLSPAAFAAEKLSFP
ncbi:MAG: CPBP family intramembrane glutamic endopeptidase [Candidatus Caldarchaeum sp.]